MDVKHDSVKRILLFSGKRKSGKDYITDKLLIKLGIENAEIIRISEPIKSFWAKEKSLDLKQLLSDGAYKEKYRKEMIIWSDEMRAKDYGVFCREASKSVSKETVIVSDIRRKTDIKWFCETFGTKVKLIRIKCQDCVRENRGWKFESGVDDIQSECDLDDWNEWDLLIENDGLRDIESILDEICSKFVS
ncbi:hypothetical protein ACKWTF_006221 [Chironomus riparius]